MSLIAFMAAATTGADAEAAKSFPPFEPWHFPSQLFWLALSFAILYAFLAFRILPRLSANIERRNDQIASDLDEAARLNDKSKEADQALDISLAKAKANARQTAADAQAEMASEIADETRRIDAQINDQLDAAEARIAKLRSDAMANVSTVADEATDAILSKFGVSATDKVRSGAVKSALGQ